MYLANFRKHWAAQITHMVIGAAIAGLTRENPTAAKIGTGFVIGRQTLEFLKRRDTPGIDLFWFILGFWGIVSLQAYKKWRNNGKLTASADQDSRPAGRE